MTASLRRIAALAALISVTAASCGGRSVDVAGVPTLPATDTEQVLAEITAAEAPVVVNVWASWCIPCRSEAPLLEAAANRFVDEVRFIGLNVRDDQDGARGFIAEFFPDAPIIHVFDAAGNIPLELGASRAVPITLFYGRDGSLSSVHTGVLDERTLALGIDEILAGG